jgi:hypothetical protein
MGFFNISTMSGVFLLIALVVIMIAFVVKMVMWFGKEGNSEKFVKTIHSLFKRIGSLAKTIVSGVTQKSFERIIPKSRQPRREVVKPIPLRPIEEYRGEEVDTATRLLDLHKRAEELERSEAAALAESQTAAPILSESGNAEILTENELASTPKLGITVNEEERATATHILQLRERLNELEKTKATKIANEGAPAPIATEKVEAAPENAEEQIAAPILFEPDNAEIVIIDNSEVADENKISIPEMIQANEPAEIIKEEQVNDIADTVAISEETSIINLDEKSPDAIAVAKLIRAVNKESAKKINSQKIKEEDVNIIEKILELKNKIGKSSKVKEAYESLLISGLTKQAAENFKEAANIDNETLTAREQWLVKKDELLIEEKYVRARYLQHQLETKEMQKKLLDNNSRSKEVEIPELEKAVSGLPRKSKAEIEKVLSEVK